MPPPEPPATVAPAAPQPGAGAEESRQLRESNRALRRTLDEVRQQNDALLEEVVRLRQELNDVRERVDAAAAQPAPPPQPEPFVSPIVPHSQNPERSP